MSDYHRDLYYRLGITRYATNEQIEKAYGAIKVKDEDVENAFAILSDKKKRRVYDNFGLTGISNGIEDAEDLNLKLRAKMTEICKTGANILPTSYKFGPRFERISGWTGHLQVLLTSKPTLVPDNFSVTGFGQNIDDPNYPHRWVTRLPAFDHIRKNLERETSNPVNTIEAPTGSGKSVSVVIALLLQMQKSKKPCKILMIQPTAVVAMALYRTLNKIVYRFGANFVGVVTKDTRHFDKNTFILIMTPGIAAASMLRNEIWFSDVILDEVHNRSLDVNLLLAQMKLCIGANSENRYEKIERFFAITASTPTIEKICAYFGGRENVNQITVEAKERIHEILVIHYQEILMLTGGFKTGGATEKMLYDCVSLSGTDPRNEADDDLPLSRTTMVNRAVQIITFLIKGDVDGDILCFVPGARIMRDIKDILVNDSELKGRFALYEMSSQIEIDGRVYEKSSIRKVILSTNVAETGITLESVNFVVDTLVENRKKKFVIGGLIARAESPISGSSLLQRMGRTGRMKRGYYITIGSANVFQHIKERETSTKAVEDDPMRHLLLLAYRDLDLEMVFKYVDPMLQDVFDSGISSLIAIGLFEKFHEDGAIQLTSFGEVVGALSLLEPELSILLLAGTVLKCQSPIITLVSALMVDASIPITRRGGATGFYAVNAQKGETSEHLTLLSTCNHASSALQSLKTINRQSRQYKDAVGAIQSEVNIKAFHKLGEISEKVKMSLDRMEIMQRTSEPGYGSNYTAGLVCMAIGFGANFGEYVEQEEYTGMKISRFFSPNIGVFRAESDYTTRLGKDKIAIYYRVEDFGDGKNVGPLTILPPYFYACFAVPFQKVAYEDGAMVFLNPELEEGQQLKIKMEECLFETAKKVRDIVCNLLLSASRTSQPGDTILLKNLINFAELIRCFEL